jgi:hypothetical protein
MYCQAQTCEVCPWLKHVEPGQMRRDQLERLQECVEPGFHQMFPCIGTRLPMVCAGYLLCDGSQNNSNVRLQFTLDDIAALVTTGELYATYDELLCANKVINEMELLRRDVARAALIGRPARAAWRTWPTRYRVDSVRRIGS